MSSYHWDKIINIIQSLKGVTTANLSGNWWNQEDCNSISSELKDLDFVYLCGNKVKENNKLLNCEGDNMIY